MRRRPSPAQTLLCMAISGLATSFLASAADDALEVRFAYPALDADAYPAAAEATALLRRSEPDAALALLGENHAENPDIGYLRGIAHIQRKDYRQAWISLVGAARSAPERADIRLSLAQIEALQRHDEEAIGWLRHATRRMDDESAVREAVSLPSFRALHRNWEFRRLLREFGLRVASFQDGSIVQATEIAPEVLESSEVAGLPSQLNVTIQLTNYVDEVGAPTQDSSLFGLQLQIPMPPAQQPPR